ncbi:MAG: zf-HC2 domain-containing protein [Chloroflexi bacterium]|nr:zf-HC2 domain-containing protein [Chloroflexota bacterium]
MNNNHIEEIRYHEYLDDDLNQAARLDFEKHVAECQACRQQMVELRHLFEVIESIPDTSFQIDLSSSILDEINKPSRLSQNWKLATAIQFGLAAILIVVAWPLLSSYYSLYEIPSINTDIAPFITDLFYQISVYSADLFDSINTLFVSINISSSQLLMGDVNAFVWPLAVSATLLLFIGNGMLLRNNHIENR